MLFIIISLSCLLTLSSVWYLLLSLLDWVKLNTYPHYGEGIMNLQPLTTLGRSDDENCKEFTTVVKACQDRGTMQSVAKKKTTMLKSAMKQVSQAETWQQLATGIHILGAMFRCGIQF